MLTSDKKSRLQVRGTNNTFRLGSYPNKAFIQLENGLAISGPELMFIELARVMDPAIHLLLGMELCGRFSRSADDPRNGTITYDIEPVTNVNRLRAFATEASWIRGTKQALETIERIVENAWSPMEAILAALIVTPVYNLGYGLDPIVLNPRKQLSERMSRSSSVDSRVPDIMFEKTNIGINYDGDDHFRLHDIATAAVYADRHPGDSAAIRQLDDTLRETRRRIVDDKHRDRDLMSMGLTVFPVTREDLEEPGGCDRLMSQVIEVMESTADRDLSLQKQMLLHPSIAKARQDFIWSIMPGNKSLNARKRLEAITAASPSVNDFSITYEVDELGRQSISISEL
ncbi:MAG: hypothetical protein IJ125_03710 [Atopobiaceae bacterium]|nr:hypothetical protein [Atopobiaceae bacterium]